MSSKDNKIVVAGLSRPRLTVKICDRDFQIKGNNELLSSIQDRFEIKYLFELPKRIIIATRSSLSKAEGFLELCLFPDGAGEKDKEFLKEAMESCGIYGKIQLITQYIAGCLSWIENEENYKKWTETSNQENLAVEDSEAKAKK